jgi:protein-S-isoprenylcysteine O-methyltransferase Ste14
MRIAERDGMAKKHVHGKLGQQQTDLTGEHPAGDRGQLVLALLFLATWAADIWLNYTTFLNQVVPAAIRVPLGAIPLAVSAYLAWMGLSTVFGRRKPERPGVIRKGVFGIVRHPIYLSEILLYLGLLMLSLSLAAAVVWGVAIMFLNAISRYEEKLLLACFGEEYRQYMDEVPMWVPRPWRLRDG